MAAHRLDQPMGQGRGFTTAVGGMGERLAERGRSSTGSALDTYRPAIGGMG